MIYLDTSVALAHLLAEDHHPPAWLWEQPLVSSRLLQYELWVRIHARQLTDTHGEQVRTLVSRVALLELSRPVLERGLDPFPGTLRTLDALHFASLEFLRARDDSVQLATYDARQKRAAAQLGIPLLAFES